MRLHDQLNRWDRERPDGEFVIQAGHQLGVAGA